MSRYTADGRRRSSMTHARHGEACIVCGRMAFGNGGKVSHARTHVREGKLIELTKDAPEGVRRAFLAHDDAAGIATLKGMGYVA